MQKRFMLFYVFLALSVVLTMLALVGTFMVTALEVEQIGFTFKIFFFHVPMAIGSAVAFGVTLVASALFLYSKDKKWDSWAATGAELGLTFGAMLLTMGIIWTRSTWGTWWTWDPRLTSYLVVMLLYGGYFVLRSAVDDETQRARYSAALGIFGYITVVFTMLAPRIVRSVHPVLFTLSGANVEKSMLYTFLLAMWAMFGLLGALVIVRQSIAELTDEVDYLKTKIGS